jgi:hypothetical protein
MYSSRGRAVGSGRGSGSLAPLPPLPFATAAAPPPPPPPGPHRITPAYSVTRPYPPQTGYGAPPPPSAPPVRYGPVPPPARAFYQVGFERGREEARREAEAAAAAAAAAASAAVETRRGASTGSGRRFESLAGSGSGRAPEDDEGDSDGDESSSSSDEDEVREREVVEGVPGEERAVRTHRRRERLVEVTPRGVEEHIRGQTQVSIQGGPGVGVGAMGGGIGASAPGEVVITAPVTLDPASFAGALGPGAGAGALSGILSGVVAGAAAAAGAATVPPPTPTGGSVTVYAKVTPESEGAVVKVPPGAKGLPEWIFPDVRVARGLAAQHANDLMGNDVDRASRFRAWHARRGLRVPSDEVSLDTYARFLADRVQDWAESPGALGQVQYCLQSVAGAFLERNLILPLPPQIYVIASDMEDEEAIPLQRPGVICYRCAMYQTQVKQASAILVVKLSAFAPPTATPGASGSSSAPLAFREQWFEVFNELVAMSMQTSPSLYQALLEMQAITASSHRSHKWRVLESESAVVQNAAAGHNPFTFGALESSPYDASYVPPTHFDIQDHVVRLLAMSRTDDSPMCMLAQGAAPPATGSAVPAPAPQLYALMILASQPRLTAAPAAAGSPPPDAAALDAAAQGGAVAGWQPLDVRYDYLPDGSARLSVLRPLEFYRYVSPQYYMVSVQVDRTPSGGYKYVIPYGAEKILLTSTEPRFQYLAMPLSLPVGSAPLQPAGGASNLPSEHPIRCLLSSLQWLMSSESFSGPDALTTHTLTTASSAQDGRSAQFKAIIIKKAAERGIPWYGTPASRKPVLSGALAPMVIPSTTPLAVSSSSSSSLLGFSAPVMASLHPAALGSSLAALSFGPPASLSPSPSPYPSPSPSPFPVSVTPSPLGSFPGMAPFPSMVPFAPPATAAASSIVPGSGHGIAPGSVAPAGLPDWFAGVGIVPPTSMPQGPGPALPPPGFLLSSPAGGGGGGGGASVASTVEWSHRHRAHPLHPSFS